MATNDHDHSVRSHPSAPDASVFGSDHDAVNEGKSGFVQRVIFGFGYAAIFIGCLLFGSVPTVVFMSVVSFMCCFEFYRMMRLGGKVPNEFLGLLAAALFPICALFDPIWLTALIFLLILTLGIWYLSSPRTRIADVSIAAFGPLYTGFMLSAVVLLRDAVPGFQGALLSIGVCGSVWVSDSFAYLAGRAFGKHKMAPRISPHKTWEGFAGGMVGSLVIWLILYFTGFYEMHIVFAILCAVAVNILGVFGDLIESRIKRSVGVKDSGNIIPGHGGMLDRSDSLIFAAITAYIMLVLGGVL